MLKYSILDQSKEELSNNTTIRLDESEFKGTVICYNPIILKEDETLSYGLDILYLVIDNEQQTNISKAQRERLLAESHNIFLDLLLLFKGQINYET